MVFLSFLSLFIFALVAPPPPPPTHPLFSLGSASSPFLARSSVSVFHFSVEGEREKGFFVALFSEFASPTPLSPPPPFTHCSSFFLLSFFLLFFFLRDNAGLARRPPRRVAPRALRRAPSRCLRCRSRCAGAWLWREKRARASLARGERGRLEQSFFFFFLEIERSKERRKKRRKPSEIEKASAARQSGSRLSAKLCPRWVAPAVAGALTGLLVQLAGGRGERNARENAGSRERSAILKQTARR